MQYHKRVNGFEAGENHGSGFFRLAYFVRDGNLKRIGRRVYLSMHYFGDEFYALQKQFSSIVLLHETALFFHGCGERQRPILM